MTEPLDPAPPIVPATPAQAHAAAEVEAHAPYLKVLLGLFVLTVGEYAFARVLKDNAGPLIFGLVLLAATKAALVAWYFMHMKFERLWVFLVLAPACILAFILTVLLYPDFVMRQEPLDEFTPPASAAPAQPVAPPAV